MTEKKSHFLKILLILLFACPFSSQAASAVEPSQKDKVNLKNLGPVEAFKHGRKIIEAAKSTGVFAPYVTNELSRLLVSIEETEKKNKTRSGLNKAKALTTVYPGEIFVVSSKVDKTRRLATLRILPTAEFRFQGGEKEAADVVMQKENGIWKFKNASYKNLNPWCLYAAEREPPDIPLKVMIEGKKFYAENIEFRGSGFLFELSSPHCQEEFTVKITARELSNLQKLMRKREKEGESSKFFIYKRPLIKPEKQLRKLNPVIEVRKSGSKLPYLKCSSNLGLTLKLREYQTLKSDRNSTVRAVCAGSMLLRLPDPYQSFMEGHFKVNFR